VRQNRDGTRRVAVILNLTPVLRVNYRVGLPQGGFWREAINSDSGFYGGSNNGNFGGITAEEIPIHQQPFSGSFTLPPLSVVAFRLEESR
jgi:1,4-alpha-glucan branching enzyme